MDKKVTLGAKGRKERLNLTFFHGTLQRSSVWETIISQLNSLITKDTESNFLSPDLYEDNPETLASWLDFQADNLSPDQNNILIGYSLGGRLALEIYKRAPEKIAGLVLVCTDPGLEDVSIKEKILEHNKKWVNNFLAMDWNELVSTWGQAEVFGGIPNPVPPKEEDFDRETLSRIWDITSKAKNPSNWPLVPKINIPTLVVTGSLDTKFDKIGKKICEQNPKHTTYIPFASCAHRVPWEDPSGFCNMLAEFLYI